MNILAFLAFCTVVTFTPGPTNVVVLATARNQGLGKALEFAAGAALAIGLLLALSAAVAACGFVDLSHLNRHFKKTYGVTASQFARM